MAEQLSEDFSRYFVPFDSMVTQYGFDEAVRHLHVLAGDDTNAVITAYLERHGEVVVDTSDALVEVGLDNWYDPTAHRVRWNYTRANLGLPESVLEVVDRESGRSSRADRELLGPDPPAVELVPRLAAEDVAAQDVDVGSRMTGE